MELTSWTIYWVTRCDAIHTACIHIAMIVTMLTFVVKMTSEPALRMSPFIRPSEWRSLALPVLCVVPALLGAIFIPTTKEACAILIIPALANNENMENVGSEFVEFARDWMKELRPVKE